MKRFFRELKRRNVLKETIAYLVVAWLVLQVGAVVLPIWNAPDWILQTLTITLALGLPLWVVFSWNYQFTSSGIQRTEKNDGGQIQTSRLNKGLNLTIIIALVAVIALIWIKPGMVTPNTSRDNSIAVLYFDSMSNSEDSSWFSDGMTEDITTYLQKYNDLTVISRTSVKRYKDSDKTIPEIAAELGVTHIVEGSVRNANGKVLITAQLIDFNDEHVWAENYQRNLDDPFGVQRSIAMEIADELNLAINPSTLEELESSPTLNTEAYRLFQFGLNGLTGNRAREKLNSSISFFEQAIEEDSNYAEAYAELAYTKLLLAYYHQLGDENTKTIEEARVLNDKAISLNPNIPRPYLNIAWLVGRNAEVEEKTYYLEKALEIAPKEAMVYDSYGVWMESVGNYEKAVELFSQNLRLNPFDHRVIGLYSNNLIRTGRTKEARELLDKKGFVLESRVGEEAIQRGYETISAIEAKDMGSMINYFKERLNEKPHDSVIMRRLGTEYWMIFRDSKSQLHYVERAYQSNSTMFYRDMFYALINNEKFVDAENITNQHLEDILKIHRNEIENLNEVNLMKGELEYARGNYLEALNFFNQIEELGFSYSHYAHWRNLKPYYEAISLANLGRSEEALEIINTRFQNSRKSSSQLKMKAAVYAALNMPDSMYINLNRDKSLYFSISHLNKSPFDAYWNDPKFKEYRRAIYLPVND